MGRVVVSEFVSLDGVMEDPGGAEGFEHGGWTFEFNRGPDGDRFKLDETIEAGALLLGRRTYDGFAAAWPNITDEVGFAAKMNAMPKYVASQTLTDPAWNNTTVLGGDIVQEVPRLKQEQEGDLLVAGSAQLVQGLTGHGLVDEYRLMVFPVVLGGGKRLFAGDGAKRTLRLTDHRPVGPDGVVVLTYTPVA